MIKGNFLRATVALASIASLITGTLLFNNLSLYTPRSGYADAGENEKAEDIEGAINFYYEQRKNQNTNIIDQADVLNAFNEVMSNASYNKTGLGLNWTEIGPNNVGGRTRAFLIDKNNPNKIFAGGVAGGLWTSLNAGTTWTKVPGIFENQALASITQAANGDIYCGTGEGLYLNGSIGTLGGGVIGGGVWKSTDGGTVFSRLTATIPTANSSGGAWVFVNKMAADLTNANRIYAATSNGMMMSNDGGTTWANVLTGGAAFQDAHDVDVASGGFVIFSQSNGFSWTSPSGDVGSFTKITKGVAGGLPKNNTAISRIEFAIAPTDANYIYAGVAQSSDEKVLGIYQSIDKGVTWTEIGAGGSWSFTPYGTKQGQGGYDNSLAVSPTDKGVLFLGGVQLWKWIQTTPGIGQWFHTGFSVHSDMHSITYHPTNPNTFYISTDGGVFKTINGGSSFSAMNKGYNVTQCYSVAFESNNTTGAGVMSGNQDNSCQYISGNYPANGLGWAEQVNGGDGEDCEISFINPNAFFFESQYGELERSSNKGVSSSDFYSAKIKSLNPGSSSFAPFFTPISLYENVYALNSADSFLFYAAQEYKTKHTGNGITKNFSGTISPMQTAATIVPDSVEFRAGNLSIKDDISGNLTGTGVTGFINHATGTYTLNFITAPSNSLPIIAYWDVQYSGGSILHINSKVSSFPYEYTLSISLNSRDSILVQDRVQSKLVVGTYKGLWLTKGPLDFTKTPEWYKIDSLKNEYPRAFAWSNDGDILYVGTMAGNLYRFSNMSAIKDSATGTGCVPGATVTCLYQPIKKNIKSFSGRAITSIAVDPNNAERVVVTLGNYGNTDYIYFSNNAATSATPVFLNKQGSVTGNKLPAMPVYSSVILKDSPNKVVIGTEYGTYATTDITQTANLIVWTEENGTAGNSPGKVPVYDLRQQTLPPWNVNNSGVLYIGTHGRGIWKCSDFYVPLSTKNKGSINNAASTGKLEIAVYPNPVTDAARMSFNVDKPCNALISIYDLSGSLVKQISWKATQEGKQIVELNVNEFASGTYLVSMQSAENRCSGKFVVTK